VPPLTSKTVPVTFDAVPVVFWFSVGTSAAWIALITTSVPFPRRYWPEVVAPARLSIAACLEADCMKESMSEDTVMSGICFRV
jgi:hypothetical protein